MAANVLIGREPRRLGLIDRRELRRRTTELLDLLGVSLDPRLTVRRLSLAERQLVEIAKAMARTPRILVLDEPTSGLREPEVERLVRSHRPLARTRIGDRLHQPPHGGGVRHRRPHRRAQGRAELRRGRPSRRRPRRDRADDGRASCREPVSGSLADCRSGCRRRRSAGPACCRLRRRRHERQWHRPRRVRR